jgi:hypothetical protein
VSTAKTEQALTGLPSSAADLHVAAQLSAGQTKLFAHHIKQRHARLDVCMSLGTIDL